MSNEEGSLKLPTVLGAPIPRTPVTRQMHEKWQTLEEVDEELKLRGFKDGPRPTGEFPDLTVDDLTTMDSKQYTTRYVEFLAWWRYTSEDLVIMKARVLQIENEMEDIELETKKLTRASAGKKADGEDKKITVEEMKLAVGSQPRFRELKQLHQRAEQAKMLLDVRLEYLERSLRVISRQVEIRRLDIEQGKTEHNMPTRGTYPAVRSPSNTVGYGRTPGEGGGNTG